MATINGTNGGDSLYGGAAADVINGLNGNDTLKGFGGADRLDGGNGIDTVFYGDSTAGVGINLATGRGVGGSAEGDTLISIENVFGSNFNDTLTGTSGANQLHGQDGNDVIKGGGGDDFLDGGNGNDIARRRVPVEHRVDAGAAVEAVGTAEALERIVAVQAADDVGCRRAIKAVAAVGSIDGRHWSRPSFMREQVFWDDGWSVVMREQARPWVSRPSVA